MNCKICSNPTKEIFQHLVLNKYLAKYYRCDNCGFMQTEEPYWLKEAYVKPINLSDTGYVSRNIYLARRTLLIFSILFGKKETFLDYAGGYGLLTRLMRDYGLNFFWTDPYTTNIFAQDFEYNGQDITALTCFECFEHFDKPLVEIENILKISNNVFFSTELLPKNIPADNWSYYGFSHGQHISFYSIETMQFLAKKFNLNYYTNGSNLHFFTKKNIARVLFSVMLSASRLPLEFILKRIHGSLTTKDYQKLTASKLN